MTSQDERYPSHDKAVDQAAVAVSKERKHQDKRDHQKTLEVLAEVNQETEKALNFDFKHFQILP